MPCRFNRRRLWTARLLLESYAHGDAIFVTLTYTDDPWTLVPRDLTLFLKRLRKAVGRPVRFFACGEYGDQSFRPHFHAVLFGVSPLEHKLIYDAWGHGFVQVGEFNRRTAQYVCGYVCKKMNKWGDGRLLGRVPEYVRMSLRPGIGSGVIDSISKQLMERGASLGVARVGDVPSEIRIAGKKYPLGRYLRSLLRCAIGWDAAVPREIVRQLSYLRSLETSVELELKAKKRTHSQKVASFRNSVSRTSGGNRV